LEKDVNIFDKPLSNSFDMFVLHSPLEQFSIISLLKIQLTNQIYVGITNATLIAILALGLFLYFFSFVLRDGGLLIPNAKQSSAEFFYDFVSGLVKEQIGEQGKPFFPLVFTIFSFIIVINLIGMVPYSFTVTSHLVITFGLSFSIFIGVTIIGFQKHGLHFFSFLLPPGAPLALAPLLVVLELVSYSFRGISLGVRLFANMMAGHTLVKIIAGFGWLMLPIGGAISFFALVPAIVVFALTGLELGVACLQTYVFTILTCIYLNDAIHLH
jgi:F-type H+-transporting ATPase subunit a